MKITKDDLVYAGQKAELSAEQVRIVWSALKEREAERPKFDFTHVAYYFGALIVIGAMGIFMGLQWEKLGGLGIFLVSCAYMIVFASTSGALWYLTRLKTLGGLLVTVAVFITPLAVYGLERHTGFWISNDPGYYRDFYRWIRGSWFLMEAATIIAGVTALLFVRFPFLTAPISFTLWYMSMDIVPLIYKNQNAWEERKWVSICFGIGLILIAYLVDRRTQRDFAFWFYLFGATAFWGGLSSLNSNSELGKFIYCLISVGMMLLSIFLERRIFIIYGAFGVMGYLGYLSYQVFRDSIMFPFALSLIGVVIIIVAVLYQRASRRISDSMTNLLPTPVRWLRPSER
ncbi:MAG: DUF2157 domain-containing protein [Chloroflexi bacterium]|nr:DUF2157 domain-containing protein [Chloroflexota bacterium]